MGLTSSSAFDREASSGCSWRLSHDGVASSWSQFCLCRYGTGVATTGLAMTIALPHLLRSRLQDWRVDALSFHIGPAFVSFGRELLSTSGSEHRMFYGVDIFFGDHSSLSMMWYCRASEWCLQLHKALLEPLPQTNATTQELQQSLVWC